MADTFTANYNFQKPTVGGDQDIWGGVLNGNLDSIDTVIKAVSDVADAALPKANGTATGPTDFFQTRELFTAMGSVSGTVTLDLSASNHFTMKLTDTSVLAFSNVPSTTPYVQTVMVLVDDSQNQALTYPASVRIVGTQGTGTWSLIIFRTFDAGTTWIGQVLAYTP